MPDIEQEVSTAVARVHTAVFAVIDQGSRDHAVEFLKDIKATEKKVKEYWGPLKKRASDAHKAIVAKENEMIVPLRAKEHEINRIVLAFDRKVERKRREMEARLQAEADEKARRERNRLLKEANKLKTPELKEQRIAEAETVSAPAIQVEPDIERTDGESTVRTWKAKLVNFHALVKAAADGNEAAMSLLQYHAVAANKLARAVKDNMTVPGVEFYEEESLRIRSLV